MALAKIAVLCSGRGSNFKRILEACKSGEIPSSSVSICILDRPAAAADIAQREGIECKLIEPGKFPDRQVWMNEIAKELSLKGVDLIVLAGFLRKIEKPLLEAFPRRILNIHPAPIPQFGGPGMYGVKVHEAVIASGVKESGVTIHLVDEFYDHGPSIYKESVPVLPGDTAATLQARVLEAEHRAYPKAIALYLKQIAK